MAERRQVVAEQPAEFPSAAELAQAEHLLGQAEDMMQGFAALATLAGIIRAARDSYDRLGVEQERLGRELASDRTAAQRERVRLAADVREAQADYSARVQALRKEYADLEQQHTELQEAMKTEQAQLDELQASTSAHRAQAVKDTEAAIARTRAQLEGGIRALQAQRKLLVEELMGLHSERARLIDENAERLRRLHGDDLETAAARHYGLVAPA